MFDRWLGNGLKYGVLFLFACLCLYPLVLAVSAALHDPLDVAHDPTSLFSSFHPDNFVKAWTLGGFGGYLVNTLIITIPTVVGTVVLSVMAGYGLAQFDFPGRSLVLLLFLMGLMVPFFSMMIPLFYTLRDIGILDTYLAVILPSIAGASGAGLPLGIFLMRGFFLGLPRELADAGRVDGAGEFSVFRYIMMPLAAPGIAMITVFSFLAAWNTFLLPLIYMPGNDNRTLATGLLLFSSGRSRDVELIAAGSLIMIVPMIVFFLLFQRHFIKGLASGAVSGT